MLAEEWTKTFPMISGCFVFKSLSGADVWYRLK